MRFYMTKGLGVLALAGLVPGAGVAQEPGTGRAQGADPANPAFRLGTVVLTAKADAQGGTASTVSAEEVARQNRLTLDDALAVVPGSMSAIPAAAATNGWSMCAASTASRCRCRSTASGSICRPRIGLTMAVS